MSHTLNPRQSTFSLASAANVGSPGIRRTSRACLNCNCSPGLLSRQGRMSSTYYKRMSLTRSTSNPSSPGKSTRASSVIDVVNPCVEVEKEINTSRRLEALRNEMKEEDVMVYIVPSEDAHQSEYTSPVDQRRSFISGFSGSAGVAVITRDITCMNEVPEGESVLSTDGRYFTQASQELDFNWSLLREGVVEDPTWQKWSVGRAVQMAQDSGREISIGIDPKLISYTAVQSLQDIIKENVEGTDVSVKIKPVSRNLIDAIWSKFEIVPQRSLEPVRVLDEKLTGMSVADKFKTVHDRLSQLGCSSIVVSALDEIAWFLNIRGSDIEYNPVFFGYLIVEPKSASLYVDDHKRFEQFSQYLEKNNIKLRSYSKVFDDVSKLTGTIALPSKSTSWEVVNHVKCNYKLVSSPLDELKSLKTDAEIEGAKIAQIKDSTAIVKFLAWLEKELVENGELIDECEADDKLTEFRREEANFVGLSFETISATGANAAVVHYSPRHNSNNNSPSMINPEKIYLCDTGSQFLEGTTDTTRTVHFATPLQEEIDAYTLVLKGHIALARTKFPEGTTGLMIDSFARQHLWAHGLDYPHSTGHGVGAFLNVHEGPMGIGYRIAGHAKFPLKKGNLLSNEPGYYKPGEFGIRIESMMYVKDADLGKTTGKKFYEFETITLVPFCKKLINAKLLDFEEKLWINNYHKRVWDTISPLLPKRSPELNWLKKETTCL